MVIIASGLICYKKFCLIGMGFGKKTTVEIGFLFIAGEVGGRRSGVFLRDLRLAEVLCNRFCLNGVDVGWHSKYKCHLVLWQTE